MTTANPWLMWCLVGHQDTDDIKDGKCNRCGTVYVEWCMKVLQQGGANQEDCCKGIVLLREGSPGSGRYA